MPPNPFAKPSIWLQPVVFASVAFVYLFFAPNFQWKNEETGVAYGADFMQEWVGARMILTGHVSELYDLDVFRSWQYDRKVVGFEWKTDQYFPPVYPPPHYVLFSPLACVPYRWAVVIWLLVLVVSAFFSAKLIADIANHSVSDKKQKSIVESKSKSKHIWLGLILFPSLLFSITLGQKSVCWLMLVCLTWRLLQSHRDYAAGMVFGILSIKPTLFFLMPLVLLRNGKWRFFVGAGLSVCIIWGTTACLIPVATWSAFAKVLGTAGNYAENIGYRLDWSCNLMTMAYSLPLELVQWCKWTICLPLTIYLLYCVFEDRRYAVDSPEKALMLLGSTILISPHSYHYDLCVLLLPILWLASTKTHRGIACYGLLAIGVAIASNAQELFHIPVLPILLIGMVCELRLSGVLPEEERSVAAPTLAISPSSTRLLRSGTGQEFRLALLRSGTRQEFRLAQRKP